eukprot:459004-Amorphochlora_amoeboformis.AAC.3
MPEARKEHQGLPRGALGRGGGSLSTEGRPANFARKGGPANFTRKENVGFLIPRSEFFQSGVQECSWEQFG